MFCVAFLPQQEKPPAILPFPHVQGHQRWGQQVALLHWCVWAELL